MITHCRKHGLTAKLVRLVIDNILPLTVPYGRVKIKKFKEDMVIEKNIEQQKDPYKKRDTVVYD